MGKVWKDDIEQLLEPEIWAYLTEEERAEVDAILRVTHEEQMEVKAEAARSGLCDFAQYVVPNYKLDPFHDLLFHTLEKVLAGEIMRLMIFAPPQHGKSLATSVIFPAYWLAHRPYDPIILASYGARLATTWSGQARSIVESREYEELFPGIRTTRDSRAKNSWRIDGYRGGMEAVGVGMGITGFPGGMVIIDDPVKDYAEAISPVYQESRWNWYEITLRQRMWETAPLVLIMTRWHEADLAGQILKSKEGHEWQILRMPALAETQDERDDANNKLGLPAGLPDPLGREPGEELAPNRFSRTYLENFRDTGSLYRWGALYQGVPRPPEGNMIKRAWLTKFVDAVPIEATRIRYWDKAGTQDGGARTAGVLVAQHNGRYYIEDVVFGQWSAEQRNAVIRQVAELDAQRYAYPDPTRPEAPVESLENYNSVRIFLEQEPGSAGQESLDISIRELAKYAVRGDKVTGSKELRIDAFAAQAEAGNVILKRADWNEAYIDELISFPNGMYKDMADATSGAYNMFHKGGLSFGIANAPEEDDSRW